jgi:hypothetical protein
MKTYRSEIEVLRGAPLNRLLVEWVFWFESPIPILVSSIVENFSPFSLTPNLSPTHSKAGNEWAPAEYTSIILG